MKAFQVILILCLLACFNSSDFSNFIFCILSNKNVAKALEIIVNGIKEKKNVISIGLSVSIYMGDLKKAASECFNK